MPRDVSMATSNSKNLIWKKHIKKNIQTYNKIYYLLKESQTTDWLSMVLRLRQHNISYMANGFYRSDDPTNSVKALKESG